MASEEQTNDVAAGFLATEEAAEWQAFTEAANAALENSEDETVTVPAGFLRRAIGEIAADPLQFEHLLRAWNRVADELGLPEEKK
jgi:hypothetical protein